MHLVSKVFRTCGIILYLIFQVNASINKTSNIFIQSLKVNSVLCHDNTCKYLLNVSGGEFLGHYPWRLTLEKAAKGSDCNVICPNYELKELETTQWLTIVEVLVPFAKDKIFFCLQEKDRNSPFGGKWVHQGTEHFLEPKNDVASSQNERISLTSNAQASNAFQDQKIDKQASNTTIAVTDTNLQTNVQQSANDDKDIIQEVNTGWVDLTHDIDVNYLSSVPRPTREESKDIEVLVYRKFVPLNDLIEEYKTKNKDNNVNKDFKNNVDTKETLQEYKKRNTNGYLNKDYSKINKLHKIHYEKTEELKTQMSKCDKSIALFKMVLDKLNSIPNATTVEDLLGRSARTDPSIQTFVNDLSINILGEIIQIISNFDQDNLTIKEDYFNVLKTNDYQSKDDNEVKQISPELLISTNNSYRSVNEAKLNQGNLRDNKAENVLEDSFPRISSEVDRQLIRKPRQIIFDDFNSVKGDDRIRIFIEGLRIEDSDKEPKIIDEGIPSVLADSWATIRLYGEGLTNRTVIAFTHDPQPYGQPCKFLMKGEYKIKEGSLQPRTALFKIKVPAPLTGTNLYVCAKNLHLGITDPDLDEEKYAHMGTESWKMFASHNKLLPLWVSIGLIVFCLMFSALFSGLNLGLMSLDRTELKIIANTGTDLERKYARIIMPVRDHGNYLLCSILLGNVAVNSTFTILLDELTSGLFAVIFSTLAIVMLGEITPQAICSRHGLMVGANTIMVTKGVMALTAPLSFPVSKLLDYFLGEEIGNVYNRERLKELVKVTTDVNDLDKDEVNIISGALELRKKSVNDVMTKLEDVFMLPISSVLDFETMSDIVKSGYSRIPVYEGGRGNIVTVLFIKDLAFVDPDDNTPLRTLCQYYQNPCNFVFEDVTLDIMFKQFKDGHKGHMAFVHRINNEGEGDPFYETVGLVTLEDVIEEMIQAEIVDETDVFLDNRSKRRRRPQNKLQDFAAFAERHENQHIHISPQLTLATFQFLSTSVEAFRPDTVSETVLKRLLRQDVIQYIKMKGKTKKDVCTYVFQQGKPVDYFLLILEGRVEVTVGRENLVFEAGPFTYFGVQALTQNIGVAESPTPSAMGSLQNINMDAMLRHTFVPDYSVRAITSLYYLTVKRSLYLAAKRATLMEKGNIGKGGTTQEFDTEVDKPPPRVNIIELMQVSPLAYPSSEKIDINDLRRMCNSASLTDPDKSYSMVQCSNANMHQPVDELRRIESTKNISTCITDVDDVESVVNNWTSKEVFDGNDLNHCKKKATFHKDTSLFSFHNISSTSHEENKIDCLSNTELRHKSNIDKPSRSNDDSNTREFKLDRGNHLKYQNDYNRDIDFTAFVKNGNHYNIDSHCNQSCDNHNNFYTGNYSKANLDYAQQQIKKPSLKIANISQIDSKPIDFQIEYKAFETDSSNQEHKSSQEMVSTEPPYSIDRFLELEKDTVDYEKEIRDETFSVLRRTLETEQIMMMQLAKIIQMLERNHT